MSRSNIFIHKTHKAAASRYRTYVTLTLCLLMLSDAWASTVQAAETQSESTTQSRIELSVMLHDSGFTRLYKDLAATVLTETRLARQSCEDTSAKADKVQRFISQALDVDKMTDASVVQLSHSFEQSLFNNVADLTKSGIGRVIQEAEVQLAELPLSGSD